VLLLPPTISQQLLLLHSWLVLAPLQLMLLMLPCCASGTPALPASASCSETQTCYRRCCVYGVCEKKKQACHSKCVTLRTQDTTHPPQRNQANKTHDHAANVDGGSGCASVQWNGRESSSSTKSPCHDQT
jgi:hypothetical protein